MKDIKIHKTAIVETNTLGIGSRVWAFTHIMKHADIGENCNIGEHCYIESGAVIGDGTIIKNGNMIWDGVTIEKNVFIGPGVIFTNDLYPRSRNLPQAETRYSTKENWHVPTLVKRGSTLGAGAVILAGVTIGEFAMVGAAAVVTRAVPPNSLVNGNPAEIKGWVCRCGRLLKLKKNGATCSDCRKQWLKNGNYIFEHTTG